MESFKVSGVCWYGQLMCVLETILFVVLNVGFCNRSSKILFTLWWIWLLLFLSSTYFSLWSTKRQLLPRLSFSRFSVAAVLCRWFDDRCYREVVEGAKYRLVATTTTTTTSSTTSSQTESRLPASLPACFSSNVCCTNGTVVRKLFAREKSRDIVWWKGKRVLNRQVISTGKTHCTDKICIAFSSVLAGASVYVYIKRSFCLNRR